MKHTGGCLCGQYRFETELDPMLIIQCNCSKCRKLSGSYQIGCLYSEDEIQESGETAVYEFEGGSGFINTVHFCINCYVRCKTHPAKEVMEGMVGFPLGIFDTASSVLTAVSEGELTPIEATRVMGLIDSYRRTLELTEIEGRLQALENAN